MQGYCTGPPPSELALHSPPNSDLSFGHDQCVVVVREDFIRVEDSRVSTVWISSLYISLVGAENTQTTLVAVHGGDVYLTNMTFVAEGGKASAIDVKDNMAVYISRAHLEVIIRRLSFGRHCAEER